MKQPLRIQVPLMPKGYYQTFDKNKRLEVYKATVTYEDGSTELVHGQDVLIATLKRRRVQEQGMRTGSLSSFGRKRNPKQKFGSKPKTLGGTGYYSR